MRIIFPTCRVENIYFNVLYILILLLMFIRLVVVTNYGFRKIYLNCPGKLYSFGISTCFMSLVRCYNVKTHLVSFYCCLFHIFSLGHYNAVEMVRAHRACMGGSDGCIVVCAHLGNGKGRRTATLNLPLSPWWLSEGGSSAS